jgi:hypothetical protein
MHEIPPTAIPTDTVSRLLAVLLLYVRLTLGEGDFMKFGTPVYTPYDEVWHIGALFSRFVLPAQCFRLAPVVTNGSVTFQQQCQFSLLL